jgi:hypothetical protein
MAKISDIYSGDYVSAGELPDGRRIAAVIQFAGVELIGSEQQQKKVVLTLAATDGRPWPRKMILNKTNAGVLASVCGDETAAWTGRTIEVWKEPVSFQGKIVSGIKLAPAVPAMTSTAIPMPAPAPSAGNGKAPGAAMAGYTVPLPGGMPTAADDLNDAIPF